MYFTWFITQFYAETQQIHSKVLLQLSTFMLKNVSKNDTTSVIRNSKLCLAPIAGWCHQANLTTWSQSQCLSPLKASRQCCNHFTANKQTNKQTNKQCKRVQLTKNTSCILSLDGQFALSNSHTSYQCRESTVKSNRCYKCSHDFHNFRI